MKPNLLIAAQSTEQKSTLVESLSEHFATHSAESFEQAIDTANSIHPQISVIDISFDQQRGLELCESLAAVSDAENCHCVLLSEDNTPAVIVSAFEHGVTDYIFKPFNKTALIERLLRLSRDIKAVAKLAEKDAETNTVAEIALAQSSAYGKGLELMSRLNNCRDGESLAREVLLNFSSQGFHGVIQLRGFQGGHDL